MSFQLRKSCAVGPKIDVTDALDPARLSHLEGTFPNDYAKHTWRVMVQRRDGGVAEEIVRKRFHVMHSSVSYHISRVSSLFLVQNGANLKPDSNAWMAEEIEREMGSLPCTYWVVYSEIFPSSVSCQRL